MIRFIKSVFTKGVKEECELLYLTREGVLDKKPWYFDAFIGGSYFTGEVAQLLTSIGSLGKWSLFHSDLCANSLCFQHYMINEPCSKNPLDYMGVVVMCNQRHTLEEVSAKYPREFPNYVKKKKREELLSTGKEDFIKHLTLLKEEDPELAKHKVLEIIGAVL